MAGAEASKRRIDQLLVDRGLAATREKAQALLLAGDVMVDGQRVDKPGRTVANNAHIEVVSRLAFVSRGGIKLAAALDEFRIRVDNKVCLDIGASTGGFTDCLLQRGAARVYAVDVGKGQIDWKLRTDPRVVLREEMNARFLSPDDIGEPVDFAAIDVSFISVTLIAPRLPAVLRPAADFVILVKPQFEVGRGLVGKGGIVKEPELHRAACQRVAEAVAALGYRTHMIESPILGAEGNREFLLHATR
jgi:23S rRNA (cytidine1920-2'-O)/16S rRNA (cytidine1409-2'-O)-methyltransferase